jgi:hypothetical protein
MNLFVLFLGQATYLSSEVAVDDISSWLLNLNWVMPSYLGPLNTHLNLTWWYYCSSTSLAFCGPVSRSGFILALFLRSIWIAGVCLKLLAHSRV